MGNTLATAFYEQWKIYTNWINGHLSKLSDEQLKHTIAPGKNHGVWLLGHLIESEDDLCKYLGKGPMLFPQYEALFGQGSTLRSVEEYPPISQLRSEWQQILERNDTLLSQIKDEEWNEPHALLTPEQPDDFFRTKGRCISIWQLHQMYHCGQLTVLSATSTSPT